MNVFVWVKYHRFPFPLPLQLICIQKTTSLKMCKTSALGNWVSITKACASSYKDLRSYKEDNWIVSIKDSDLWVVHRMDLITLFINSAYGGGRGRSDSISSAMTQKSILVFSDETWQCWLPLYAGTPGSPFFLFSLVFLKLLLALCMWHFMLSNLKPSGAVTRCDFTSCWFTEPRKPMQ